MKNSILAISIAALCVFFTGCGKEEAGPTRFAKVSFPFLYADEETMDITIEVLDAGDNALFTHTVSNVPFKRNRKTILQGAIFTAGASSSAFQKAFFS